MRLLKFEFWTPATPADAGTDHPLYFSAFFNAGPNLAQSGEGETGTGEHAVFEFLVSDSATVLESASVMLNGLAPDAPDNWRPNRVKITFGSEVLIDTPWDLPFDQTHRSHEVYRRAFDSARCDGGGSGKSM